MYHERISSIQQYNDPIFSRIAFGSFFQEVDDADVQLLHETTGQPKDRCLAALLNVAANVSSEARLETAAAELMDEVDAQVRIVSPGSVGLSGCCIELSKVVKLQRFPREMFTRKYLGGKMIQFDDIRCHNVCLWVGSITN